MNNDSLREKIFYIDLRVTGKDHVKNSIMAMILTDGIESSNKHIIKLKPLNNIYEDKNTLFKQIIGLELVDYTIFGKNFDRYNADYSTKNPQIIFNELNSKGNNPEIALNMLNNWLCNNSQQKKPILASIQILNGNSTTKDFLTKYYTDYNIEMKFGFQDSKINIEEIAALKKSEYIPLYSLENN